MRALALVVLLAGCPVPAPRPTPVPNPDFGGLPDCPAKTPEPRTAYVCGTLETFDHLRCVACDVDAPCLHRATMVYCTPSCIDRACTGR